MKFHVYKQNPKSNRPVIGTLSIHGKEAHIFDDQERLVLQLAQPEFLHANSTGIGIKGFEPCGCERNGTPKFRYQEWWMVFEK